jgi:hypothetical protein
VFGRLTRLVQANWLAAGFAAAVVVFSALYFIFAMPVSPEGNYHLHVFGRREERIIFHGGKVEIQIPGSTNRWVGVYSKSGNDWIFQSFSIANLQLVLVPDALGIGSFDPKTKSGYEYFPRSSLYWLFFGKIVVNDTIDAVNDIIDEIKHWFSP